MPFELGGKYGNEAFDAETGMRIRSLGARGPEIETHFWKVELSDRNFEFSTSVMEKSDSGIYNVLLTPGRLFLSHINNPDIPLDDRRNLLKIVIDGLYFIFPTYFKAPICFRKGRPPASYGELGMWSEAELSRQAWH
jgi:hypothetical protein